jgi:hypothetical protein
MTEPRIVQLEGKIREGASIKFLYAQLPPREYEGIPFAIVGYNLGGVAQDRSLRLDLDKRAFLDHFENDIEKEEFIRKATLDIVDAIAEYLQRDET